MKHVAFSFSLRWGLWSYGRKQIGPHYVLGLSLCGYVLLLFGLAPVNTHVLQRPLALFDNCQQSEWQARWNNKEESLFVVEAPRERLWQSKGDPADTRGTRQGWPWEPLGPLPYLLMSADVPACMIIASTGGEPLIVPFYKSHRGHQANRTFYMCACIFKTVYLDLVYASSCFGCVHMLLKDLHIALLMAPWEGWKCEEWQRGGGRWGGGGGSGWRQISQCLNALGRTTMHWHPHLGTSIGLDRI